MSAGPARRGSRAWLLAAALQAAPLAALGESGAPAAAYYVAPSGQKSNDGSAERPWPSLAYAFSRVGGGHEIVLEPGIYAPLVIPARYRGSPGHPTVVRSQHLWRAVVNGRGRPGQHGIRTTDGADDVVIEGFEVRNAAVDGIKTYGKRAVVRYNWVHDCGGQGIAMHGTGPRHWDHGVIEHNLMERNGTRIPFDHGIYADGEGLLVRGNIARHNKALGIQLAPLLSGSVVAGNLTYGHAAEPGYFVQSSTSLPRNEFTGNISVNDQGGLEDWGSTPFRLYRGNRFVSGVSTSALAALDVVRSTNVADYTALLGAVLAGPERAAAPPRARLLRAACYGGACRVEVGYSGGAAFDLSRLSAAGVVFTGPAGYRRAAQDIDFFKAYTDGDLMVRYFVPAPAGGWGRAAGGTYAVSIASDAVADNGGAGVVPELFAFTVTPP